jgi:hypothetical protein
MEAELSALPDERLSVKASQPLLQENLHYIDTVEQFNFLMQHLKNSHEIAIDVEHH